MNTAFADQPVPLRQTMNLYRQRGRVQAVFPRLLPEIVVEDLCAVDMIICSRPDQS